MRRRVHVLLAAAAAFAGFSALAGAATAQDGFNSKSIENWSERDAADERAGRPTLNGSFPDPNTRAFAAAGAAGDVLAIRRLKRQGADPNGRGAGDATPLIWTAAAGNTAGVNALLQAGANVDQADRNGFSPLIIAVFYKKPDVVEALLTGGANVEAADARGNTALFWAAHLGRTEIADKLLMAGADPFVKNRAGQNPATVAVAAENTGVLKLFAPHFIKRSVLNTFAETEVTDLAERLVDGTLTEIAPGRPVNAPGAGGVTLLMAAVLVQDGTAIDALLDAGGDPNAVDDRGASAMHHASTSTDPTILGRMLASEANVNAATTRGETPLMRAAQRGRNANIEALLKNGADVDAADRDGNTALIYSVVGKDANTTGLLLRLGAKATIRNEAGLTARDYAVALEMPEIARLLPE